MTTAIATEELLARYGRLRRIRYLISSAVEFKETIASTSRVIGHAETVAEAVTLQKLAKFLVMPLSSSPENFVACFDIPTNLLGERNGSEYDRPDYLSSSITDSDFTFLHKESLTSCSYRANCLWEINVAHADFERRLKCILTEANRRTLRDALVINVKPAAEAEEKHLINFVMSNLSASDVEKLQAASTPATESVLG
jgi:hypothetical protein